MAPKAAAAPKKASKPKSTTSTHGSFQDMIKNAIANLKERNGSSRQAIKKYIQANNNLNGMTDARFNTSVNRAIAKGAEDGAFEQPKGASGPVKIKKTAPKAAAPKTEAKPKAAATKTAKATTTKKAAPAKKTATATKTATTKKAPAAKANASKPRAKKASTTSGPAVSEEKFVLGKTKSGRVTKSAAPSASKTTKKAAPKKAAATKKAAPKKATPKKTEAAA